MIAHRLTPLPRRILLAGLALAFTGCAQIPALGQLTAPKDSPSYAASQSFAAPATNWPDDGWWQAYADPQLDKLIGESLAGSPDLVAASARLRRAEAAGQVAGAPLLPQLAANGSLTKQRQSYTKILESNVI